MRWPACSQDAVGSASKGTGARPRRHTRCRRSPRCTCEGRAPGTDVRPTWCSTSIPDPERYRGTSSTASPPGAILVRVVVCIEVNNEMIRCRIVSSN